MKEFGTAAAAAAATTTTTTAPAGAVPVLSEWNTKVSPSLSGIDIEINVKQFPIQDTTLNIPTTSLDSIFNDTTAPLRGGEMRLEQDL